MTSILLATAALAGCAAPDGNQPSRKGRGSDVPAVRIVGEPVSCIQLQSIRESRVRDDWTIDFRTNGNQWYRNTLPNRCNGLGFEQAFSYATSLSRLCNVDIITVISTAGGPINRGSCGLGEFTPVELVK
ncbi:MAG: hypothetical protein C0409_06565 [Novosphingobium sp.]|nr:hypothetical protein [Novosphingobium sp.]